MDECRLWKLVLFRTVVLPGFADSVELEMVGSGVGDCADFKSHKTVAFPPLLVN